MWQVNIQIGGTVLGASLRADGCVSIFRLSPSGEFCDLDSKGEMWASFWQDEFMITDGSTIEELSYNVAYPLILYPGLKKWLQQQNMSYPNFKE